MKLKDKVALITGAGSGLGAEIAFQMANEGAKIGVNDISSSGIEETCKALKKMGMESLELLADVSKVEQVKAMFEKIKSHWGTIDILVNNAGMVAKPGWEDYMEYHTVAALKARDEIQKTGKVQESMKILSSFKNEWWLETIDIMLNGTFYCTREALKIMEEKHQGKIINMASTTGLIGDAVLPAYAVAKGAIITFTKSAAKDVAGSGILVNAVAPGYCDTPLLATMDEERLRSIINQIPLGRAGTMKEIASLFVYLASDDANYITGQVISPNGGFVI